MSLTVEKIVEAKRLMDEAMEDMPDQFVIEYDENGDVVLSDFEKELIAKFFSGGR